MNVLMANSYHYPRAGAEQVFLSEMALLRDRGHMVVPFSMQHPANLSSAYSEYFVSNVDFRGYGSARPSIRSGIQVASRVLYSLETRSKLTALLRDYNPHVAHLHNIQHHLSPSLIDVLSKRGIPLVWTMHDYELICPNTHLVSRGHVCEMCKGRRYYMAVCKRCKKDSLLPSILATCVAYFQEVFLRIRERIDLFIAPSRFLRDKMIEFGLPGDKIVHISNFVDASHFDPDYGDDGYFVCASRLDPEKGIETLVRAAIKSPKVQLRVLGEGTLRGNLEAMVEQCGVDNIRFLGFRTGEELTRLIAGSLAVVLPSEWYENNPIAVLEAFSLGKPVVGSRIGGIPELIDDGVDGLLFSAGDTEDLRNRMEYLLANPAVRRSMGRNARQKVETSYGPQLHYQRLMEAYSQVGALATCDS